MQSPWRRGSVFTSMHHHHHTNVSPPPLSLRMAPPGHRPPPVPSARRSSMPAQVICHSSARCMVVFAPRPMRWRECSWATVAARGFTCVCRNQAGWTGPVQLLRITTMLQTSSPHPLTKRELALRCKITHPAASCCLSVTLQVQPPKLSRKS